MPKRAVLLRWLVIFLPACGATSAAPTAIVEASAPSLVHSVVQLPADGTTHPDEPTDVVISYQPADGTEFTRGYPVSLRVVGPGCGDGNTLEIGSRDAASLHSDEISFAFRCTPPSPGLAEFSATIRFSVCFPSRCEVGVHTDTWSLVVGERR